MRNSPRPVSLGIALLFSLLTAWPGAAQTDAPVNINAADARTLAEAIDHRRFGDDELLDVGEQVCGALVVGWRLLEANGLTRCPPKDGREQSTSTEVPRAKVAL